MTIYLFLITPFWVTEISNTFVTTDYITLSFKKKSAESYNTPIRKKGVISEGE